MADIAKFQGTDIANLAKAWGTTTSSLAKIMGLTVGSIAGTVTAGTPRVFESANSSFISVCMMDSTHAIVGYQDAVNSSYGTACCLTLSGTTITAETPVVFESAASSYISVCMMDSTHAIVAYRDGGNSDYGTACCLTLSGTTITAGTPVVFESAASIYISVCMMDSTHAIVGYRDGGNSSYGTACCLTLSGTTITAETPVVFESAITAWLSVCMMDSTHAIVVYQDAGNSSYGTACCLTLSGTTITAGTPVVFESASSSYISVCMMDSTHAIVGYQDAGNSSYGTACCLTLSGTTITAGTPVVFESANSSFISVCMMDSTHAIVVYSDAGNSSYGTACCLTLSGTTITAGTTVVFESAYSTYISVCMMDSTHAIVGYRDAGNSNYGTACCLTLS
jgi:urease beta subunit